MDNPRGYLSFVLVVPSGLARPCRAKHERFAFPPQSTSNSLVSGKARNIDALRQNPRWLRSVIAVTSFSF